MSIKMKGLLKGLRYISQIFEEEEEENDIQIGFPTDVKHVAHIGWDGPSVNSPSWMNEFKGTENASSNGDANNKDVQSVSQDSTAKKSAKNSPGRDLPALPKSRRQPSVDSIGSLDSPVGSPTQNKKSSRRRSKQKESKDSTSSPRGGGGESSNSQDPPNIPKKTRRKKSKDNGGDDSVKSSSSSRSSRAKGSRHGSRHGSDDGSITKHYSGEISGSGLVSLQEDDVKQ